MSKRGHILSWIAAAVIVFALSLVAASVAHAVPKWQYEHHLRSYLRYAHPHKRHYGAYAFHATCASHEYKIPGARMRHCHGTVSYKRTICIGDACETIDVIHASNLFDVTWIRGDEPFPFFIDETGRWRWHS